MAAPQQHNDNDNDVLPADNDDGPTYPPLGSPGGLHYFYDPSHFAELQPLIAAVDVIAAEAQAVERQLLDRGVAGEVVGNFSQWAGSEQFSEVAHALETGQPAGDAGGGWLQWWNHHDPKDPSRVDGLEWTVYGLVYQRGGYLESNGSRCPETFKLLKAIPNIRVAGFSRLKPGTEIAPHTGHTGRVFNSLAFHLGLVVPPGDCCGLQVGPEVHVWQRAQQAVVFDDTFRHSAWNRHPDLSRIVLYVDFEVQPTRWSSVTSKHS